MLSVPSVPVALAALALALSTAAPAEVLPEFGGECVPVARAMSGVQIYGDAWTWWDKADGLYKRGEKPEVGAVLVFRPTERMRLGHVAVISRVVSPRIVMITHSNWSRIGGVRGHIERDVTLVDVSDEGDWSAVRVWYDTNGALGGSTYPTYGFIYGRPAQGGGKGRAREARIGPSPKLSGPSPDIVGAVIDSIG